MRFGFQTIMWDPEDDLTDALPLISQIGFTGVEIAQPPSAIGRLESFIKRLDDHGLQLIGLAGGSVDQRMKYLGSGEFSHRGEKPYLYIDDWTDGVCDDALRDGYRLALHPHYPGPSTRLEYAWKVLEAHPGLEWLPDTGHLHIAWEDLTEAINAYATRLAGVHLKDWTGIFGRSTYCVAKGFIELGRGEVLDPKNFDLVTALAAANFGDRWIVVELDYARIDPQTSIVECAGWLAERMGFQRRTLPAVFTPREKTPTDLGAIAARTPELFYQKAVRRLHLDLPCIATSIWVHNADSAATETGFEQSLDIVASASAENRFVLLEVYPDERKFGPDAFIAGAWFCHFAVESGVAHMVNIEAEAANRKTIFPSPYLQTYLDYGVERLISIPVLATYNKHQVRFVIRYLLKDQIHEGWEWEAVRAKLISSAQLFGQAADTYIGELCQRAAARTRSALDRRQDSSQMLADLAGLVSRELSCQGTSIFLTDPPGLTLRLGGTTGITWDQARNKPSLQCYSKTDNNVTGLVFRERRSLLHRNLRKLRKEYEIDPSKSEESVDNPERAACALAPFFGRGGKLLGVVRCRNKTRSDGSVRQFTEDDLAIIQSIFQTASPLLEMRRASDQRSEATQKLFHEIATPLTAVSAAVGLASAEIDAFQPGLLSQPYLADALSWIQMIGRLIQTPSAELSPTPSPTLLYGEVIIPAVSQIGDLIKQNSLSPKRIDYGRDDDFKVIPRLMIDRNMFQQVFLNLLTNAVKYFGDRRTFKVEIRPERTPNGFLIRFRDWGIGIKEGWQEAIFEEGVRGEEATRSDVQGRGLGLWFAQRALSKHGASISVTRMKDPTEFTIFLPSSLRQLATPQR